MLRSPPARRSIPRRLPARFNFGDRPGGNAPVMLHADAMRPPVSPAMRKWFGNNLCEARGFLFSVFDMPRFVLRGRRRGLTVCRLLLRHLFQGSKFPLSRGVLFPATKGMGHASETAIR